MKFNKLNEIREESDLIRQIFNPFFQKQLSFYDKNLSIMIKKY